MYAFFGKFKQNIISCIATNRSRGGYALPGLFCVINTDCLSHITEFMSIKDQLSLIFCSYEGVSPMSGIYHKSTEDEIINRRSIISYLFYALPIRRGEISRSVHDYVLNCLQVYFFKYYAKPLSMCLCYEDFCFILPRPITVAQTHGDLSLDIDRYAGSLLEVLRLLPGVRTLNLTAALPATNTRFMERHVPIISGRCELQVLALTNFGFGLDDVYAISLLPNLLELTLIYSHATPILADLFSKLHRLQGLRSLTIQSNHGFDNEQLLDLQGCDSLAFLRLPYPIAKHTRTFLELHNGSQVAAGIKVVADSQSEAINACAAR